MHVVQGDAGVRHGPEMDARIVEWLTAGGPFPAMLTMTVASDEAGTRTQMFTILDRDERGFIASVVSRKGKKGFVLRVQDPDGHRQYAAKLCIPADYTDSAQPRVELERSARLQDIAELVHLVDRVGRVTAFDSQPATQDDRPWVCFVSDWLQGQTLEQIVTQSPETVTPELVVTVAESLLKAVLLLERRQLKHDDLHLGNLMLVPTSADLRAIDPQTPDMHLKLIDLGSLKPLDRVTYKHTDDWSSIAQCLAELHNVLHRQRRIASRYPTFLKKIAAFVQDLSDEDPARHFPDDASYILRIREAAAALTFFPPDTAQFQPFEAISAEHLANDALLLKLFVDHLPWITLVQSKEPTALIGPRGCGKSMVFRYMSARTHITAASAAPEFLDKLGFFGVYIGCASDLGNDLLWIARQPDRPARMAAEITTFFTLVLVRELLRSLATCTRAPRVAAAMGLSESQALAIATFIQDHIPNHLDVVRLRGMDPLQVTADAIDKLRLRLTRDMLEQQHSAIVLQPTFVREICRTVVDKVPGLARWRIVFLLDDYTSHRLSAPVQTILNGVVWQRDPSHLFKISSEPHGFDASHLDGARIDPNREYTPVDAGELTLGAEEGKERRSFVMQLLDKRLEAADYTGRAHTLIGDSAYRTDVELAKAIRAQDRGRSGQRSYYHGLQVISNAWSGDIATVLHMLREMFARAGITRTTTTPIPVHVQHQSIVKVCTALRERVKGYHPFGTEMAKILLAFGDLTRRLLVEAPDFTTRSGKPTLHRKYRLEMTLPDGADFEAELRKQDEHLVLLARELVRRAIFIQLPPSRGKEGAARRTVRWQLRSSLLPSFGSSLVRKHYIDIKRIEDFIDFLVNTDSFVDRVYNRYAASRKNDLFDDLDRPADEDDE